MKHLKGLCHDDFVILGHFYAKFLLSGFTYAQHVRDKLWGEYVMLVLT